MVAIKFERLFFFLFFVFGSGQVGGGEERLRLICEVAIKINRKKKRRNKRRNLIYLT